MTGIRLRADPPFASRSVPGSTGHLRTTKAHRARSSVVECLLCKEDAQGSNPCESIRRVGNRVGYTPDGGTMIQTDAPFRESAIGKGQMHASVKPTGRAMTTVCTCSPGTHWTRSSGCSGTTIDDYRQTATMPADGLLGSRADEGRAKLR